MEKDAKANMSVLITSSQCRAARGLLGWTQKDLADQAGLSVFTIKNVESTPGTISCRTQTAERIVNAFRSNGITFIDGGAFMGPNGKETPPS